MEGTAPKSRSPSSLPTGGSRTSHETAPVSRYAKYAYPVATAVAALLLLASALVY